MKFYTCGERERFEKFLILLLLLLFLYHYYCYSRHSLEKFRFEVKNKTQFDDRFEMHHLPRQEP